MLPRVANGFDLHRLADGGHLVLAGVTLPLRLRLLGHSDADVILHALTDALLAVATAGDIGQHFPDDDPRWKGADSKIFLEHALDLIKKAGGRLYYADITVIADRPKLQPYRQSLIASLSRLMGLPVAAIGFKATTTEGQNHGESIACLATVSVLWPDPLSAVSPSAVP